MPVVFDGAVYVCVYTLVVMMNCGFKSIFSPKISQTDRTRYDIFNALFHSHFYICNYVFHSNTINSIYLSVFIYVCACITFFIVSFNGLSVCWVRFSLSLSLHIHEYISFIMFAYAFTQIWIFLTLLYLVSICFYCVHTHWVCTYKYVCELQIYFHTQMEIRLCFPSNRSYHELGYIYECVSVHVLSYICLCTFTLYIYHTI